jgi:hypothetical protein
MARCDFCNTSTNSGRNIEPHSRTVLFGQEAGPLWTESGVWIACEDCAGLIGSKEWKTLMRRAMEMNPAFSLATAPEEVEGLCRFIAVAWAGVFGEPLEVFL